LTTFANRAKVRTSTIGTGTITLGQSVTGFNTFAEAGITNGASVSYTIEDGNNFEVGEGSYSSEGPTLFRTKVLSAKVHGQTASALPISLSGNAVVFLTATAEDLTSIATGESTDLASLTATSAYVFHGFAGSQGLGDTKFYDISGIGAHGVFGEDLSTANAWANVSYVSTVNPAGGTEDSVIRMPGLNLDYAGGEKMILWWLGKVTAEGSNVSFVGDGIASGYPGVRVRVRSDQKFDVVVTNGSQQEFSIPTSSVVADGSLHSFAWVLDGSTFKYSMWVDELQEPLHFDQWAIMGSGVSRDTRNSNTFNIGSAAPKIAASTDGIASQTRAFVLLRLASDVNLPSLGKFTKIFDYLRATPNQFVKTGALAP
jgi:hypothetical protein